MKVFSKKKVFATVITVLSILCISASVFAYSFAYSSMPSAKQTAITDAYSNNYLNYDQGTEYLSLEEFKDACKAFSTLSNPSWTTVSNWQYTSLADASEFTSYGNNGICGYTSIVARAIYAECSNLSERQRNMDAVGETIMNRARVNYSGTGATCKAQVLASGQFSCMRDGNIGSSNPVYYTSDIDNWCYALFVSNHLENDIEQWGYHELGQYYYNFYDISAGMPFYIYSGGTYTQCTSLNVTSANRYKTGSTYNVISANAPPIKIGTHVYFSY